MHFVFAVPPRALFFACWTSASDCRTLAAMSNKLTPTELKHFDGELRKILGQAEDTRDQIESESLDLSGGGLDRQGDEGSDNEFEEVDLDSLDVERAVAEAAVAALERMSNGTYGICIECSADIPRGRLEAEPYAPLCISCQEALEEETA